MEASKRSTLLYQQIYEDIAADIESGKLKPGDSLPSENRIALDRGVSRITSKRALQMLTDRGMIQRVQGKGSFVTVPSHNHQVEPRANGSKKFVALVMEAFSDVFGAQIVHAIEEVCTREGYGLLIFVSRSDSRREEQAIETALSIGAAGLIVMPIHGEFYSKTYLRLILDEFPLVLIDRSLDGLEASYVGTDNVEAVATAIRYLFDRNHRAIAFMAEASERASTIDDRRKGFENAHNDRGVPIRTDFWLEDIATGFTGEGEAFSVDARTRADEEVSRVAEHLANYPEVTAVFASEYGVAEIVHEAALSLGRRVPEDLAIVCVDSYVDPIGRFRFTHLRQNEYEMGRSAAELLLRHLGGRRRVEKRLLTAELEDGETT
mgnify:FL=1